MAETYPVFQGNQPNIDIHLFGDAATQGTNIGKAIPGKLDAIATGALEGYKEGANIRATEANTRAQEATNTVNEDPAVAQARKDKIVADAQIAQAEAAAARANGNLEQRAKVAIAKQKEAEANQKVGDMNALDAINQGLDTNLPPDQMQILLQKGQGALSRNTDAAQQVLARSTGKVDASYLETLRKGVDAVEIEKTRVALAQASQRNIQAEALERAKDIRSADATIMTSSDKVRDLILSKQADKTYDPNKLKFLKAEDYLQDPATGKLKLDPITQQPILDPHVTASAKRDPRFFAVYDGKEIDVLDSSTGEKAFKAQADSMLQTAAIMGDKTFTKPTAPEKPAPASFESKGIGAGLDKQTPAASPARQFAPSAADLAGKTPEQQKQFTEGFNRKVAQMNAIPRAYRDVVLKINTDPALKGETPVLKALASVESGGNNNAVSPTGVTGLLQITEDTWNGLVKNYPNAMKGADRSTPEGQVIGAKTLLVELHGQFQDLALDFAAYNAGGPQVMSAVADTKKQGQPVTWANVKQNLSKYVSPEKFKEVENYPERVLKYYSYYV